MADDGWQMTDDRWQMMDDGWNVTECYRKKQFTELNNSSNIILWIHLMGFGNIDEST